MASRTERFAGLTGTYKARGPPRGARTPGATHSHGFQDRVRAFARSDSGPILLKDPEEKRQPERLVSPNPDVTRACAEEDSGKAAEFTAFPQPSSKRGSWTGPREKNSSIQPGRG